MDHRPETPKGIRSFGGRLWVSDIDQLIGVDIAQGKIAERVPVPDSEFLNDVACDAQGAVYVSDMTKNKIHRYRDGKLAVFAEGEDIGKPQRAVGGRQSTGRRRLGIEQRRENNAWPSILAGSGIGEEALITPDPVGNLDGVETVAKGSYLVSDGPPARSSISGRKAPSIY